MLDIPVSGDFRDDAGRADDLEEAVRLGTHGELDGGEDLAQPGLPLRRRSQCVDVALRSFTNCLPATASGQAEGTQGGFRLRWKWGEETRRTSFIGIPRTRAERIRPMVASSAWRLRLIGIRRNIPAEMACGKMDEEE